MKPPKPTPDFPLFAHKNGQWAKKVGGRLVYFGPWADPAGALKRFLGGEAPAKLKKPYPDFPLFLHQNGQWAKRVRGRVYYFGKEAQAALDRWLAEKDDLQAGNARKPVGSLLIEDLVHRFLSDRVTAVKAGELERRTAVDYATVMERVLQCFAGRTVASLTPDDFTRLRSSFSATHGPVTLANDIQRVRVLFNWGEKNFGERPTYGSAFEKPSRAVLRKARVARFFDAVEIQAMLAVAGRQMRAMILLGINCGLGNDDCANLHPEHLQGTWLVYPRNKTGIERRCPLWPETLASLDVPGRGRVFRTTRGRSWEGSEKDNPLSKAFQRCMRAAGAYQKGRGFYGLRHTFVTVGLRTGDSYAVRYMTGHAPDSDDMLALYNESTFDGNLIRVSNFIRQWLFEPKDGDPVASNEGLPLE